MKTFLRINVLLLFVSIFNISEAKVTKSPKKIVPKTVSKSVPKKQNSKKRDIYKEVEEKQKLLQLKSIEASLKKMEFENRISRMKEEIEKLSLQKQLEEMKLEAQLMDEKIKFQKEFIETKKKIEKAKLNAEQLKIKLEKSQQELQLLTFESEKNLKLAALNAEKAKAKLEKINSEEELDKYISLKKKYPLNPLRKDGVLMISDRNIKMDGFVTMIKANYIIDRINFFNNKDIKKPIFLVIDMNMGGSVWAGAKILKAMESSKAPVYVVVKSMAASMAAIITTLAKKSFALPEAQILHHQPVLEAQYYRANTTEQEYILNQYKKWAKKLLGKVAKKMGISLDNFIKKMYKNSPNGDWQEFASEAKKLKWVDNIIKGIEYNEINKLPSKINYTRSKFIKELFDAEDEQIHLSKDNKGRTLMYLNSLPGEPFFVKKDPRIIIR